MREILFRAKTKEDSKWMEGFPVRIYDYGGKVWEMHPFETNFNVVCGVIPETICQFTGLTDKNGKKIFEGDILKWDAEEWGAEYCEPVVWDYSFLGVRQNDWQNFCEVIGNIHDNLELLENP